MRRSLVLVSYIRNFVFGVEDSLVSTVGFLSGVAIAELPRSEIFLAGTVLIFVEAISMAAGSFLSEDAAAGYLGKRSGAKPITASLIMFGSYFVTGFIPLAPYVFAPTYLALPLSITLALLGLFLLGRVTKRGGVRMLAIGGLAITIGVLVGKFLPVII